MQHIIPINLFPCMQKVPEQKIFETYADEQDIVRGPFLNNSEIGSFIYFVEWYSMQYYKQ
jgi:hypothetical protein